MEMGTEEIRENEPIFVNVNINNIPNVSVQLESLGTCIKNEITTEEFMYEEDIKIPLVSNCIVSSLSPIHNTTPSYHHSEYQFVSPKLEPEEPEDNNIEDSFDLPPVPQFECIPKIKCEQDEDLQDDSMSETSSISSNSDDSDNSSDTDWCEKNRNINSLNKFVRKQKVSQKHLKKTDKNSPEIFCSTDIKRERLKFPCYVCPLVFCRRSNFKVHMRKRHEVSLDSIESYIQKLKSQEGSKTTRETDGASGAPAPYQSRNYQCEINSKDVEKVQCAFKSIVSNMVTQKAFHINPNSKESSTDSQRESPEFRSSNSVQLFNTSSDADEDFRPKFTKTKKTKRKVPKKSIDDEVDKPTIINVSSSVNAETKSIEKKNSATEKIDEPQLENENTNSKTLNNEQSPNNSISTSIDEKNSSREPKISSESSNSLQLCAKNNSDFLKAKKFSCTECEKFFLYKDSLHCHMRTHTNDKPFRCKFCGDRFIKRSYLTRHVRLHTNDRPFKCSKCPMTFTRNDNLTSHTSRVHSLKSGTKGAKKSKLKKLQASAIIKSEITGSQSLEEVTNNEVSTTTTNPCSNKVTSNDPNPSVLLLWLTCNVCKTFLPSEPLMIKHIRQFHSSSRTMEFDPSQFLDSWRKTITLKECSLKIKRLTEKAILKQKLKSTFANLFKTIPKHIVQTNIPIIVEMDDKLRNQKHTDKEKDTAFKNSNVNTDQHVKSKVSHYSCTICFKQFQKAIGLKIHLKVHEVMQSKDSHSKGNIKLKPTSIIMASNSKSKEKIPNVTIVSPDERINKYALKSETTSADAVLVSEIPDSLSNNSKLTMASSANSVNATEMGTLPCLICDKKFSTSNELIEHYHNHKNNALLSLQSTF